MPKRSPEILIFVPGSTPDSQILPPDEASPHSLGSIASAFRRVVSIKPEDVREQWDRTLDTIMGLSSAIAKRSGDWKIEEMEVGLTLSAKGELLFIAEASAEASIKVTLKPKK